MIIEEVCVLGGVVLVLMCSVMPVAFSFFAEILSDASGEG